MVSAIELEGVSYAYKQREALKDITLAVPSGTRFALLGPNGSGKTTLFRLLSTLLKPQSGQISVAGLSLEKEPNEIRPKLGVVFQSPSVDKKLTVHENLLCHGMLLGYSRSDLETRIHRRLGEFDLADRENDRVDTLSGGLQRRVELAKALLHRPEVLLLDEPTSGLDPVARAQFWKQIHRLSNDEQMTIIYTTHAFDEAEHCLQVAILRDGALIASDTPEALRSSMSKRLLTLKASDGAALLKQVTEQFQLPARLDHDGIHLELKADDTRANALLAEFAGSLNSYHWRRPDLGDVYFGLTGETFRAGDVT